MSSKDDERLKFGLREVEEMPEGQFLFMGFQSAGTKTAGKKKVYACFEYETKMMKEYEGIINQGIVFRGRTYIESGDPFQVGDGIDACEGS